MSQFQAVIGQTCQAIYRPDIFLYDALFINFYHIGWISNGVNVWDRNFKLRPSVSFELIWSISKYNKSKITFSYIANNGYIHTPLRSSYLCQDKFIILTIKIYPMKILISCMFYLLFLCFVCSCTTSKYGCYDFSSSIKTQNENKRPCWVKKYNNYKCT